MSEPRSKCCGMGIMTPEDYIHYNGENSLPESLDLSEIDWICAECGKPCEVEEKEEE